jgi:hypothetical protein
MGKSGWLRRRGRRDHKKIGDAQSVPRFSTSGLGDQCFFLPPFFLLPPFFVAMVLFSLPFFMDATNVPLQLLECIESMKNDVKRKIGRTGTFEP